MNISSSTKELTMNDSGVYEVKIINRYFDEPKVTRFTCIHQEDVRTLAACYCGHYSGDEIECFINGKKAVLDRNFGLL